MKHQLSLGRGVGALAALLTTLVPGCFFIEDDDDRPPARIVTGFLDLDWSISGVVDPDQCDLGAVDVVDILITTTRGDFVGDFQEPCEAFLATFELLPDRYFLDAVLLDVEGFERTTVVRPPAFEIFGADILSLPIDFPASSFF